MLVEKIILLWWLGWGVVVIGVVLVACYKAHFDGVLVIVIIVAVIGFNSD